MRGRIIEYDRFALPLSGIGSTYLVGNRAPDSHPAGLVFPNGHHKRCSKADSSANRPSVFLAHENAGSLAKRVTRCRLS